MSLLCTAPSTLGRVAIFPPLLHKGIAKNSHAHSLIGCDELIVRPRNATGIDAVVGWGLKDNTLVAMEFAHKYNLPFWRLEDGFLRSVSLGVNGGTSLSMVLDDCSVYYDARRTTRLENILSQDTEELMDQSLLQRGQEAMDSIVRNGLSKYNSSSISPPELPTSVHKSTVLVVDQTAADLSVRCGFGTQTSFDTMLKAALEENPEARILVKTHPDVLSGKRQGNYQPSASSQRVHFLRGDENPIRLLELVDKVYVVTSQLGFEALMVGKPVVCFGAPFYSGWGLTDDRIAISRRTRSRSLQEVFVAAYLLYTRYVDPDTGKPCDIETVIEHLALQRREFTRNQGQIFCFGFGRHFWKKNYVRAYLRCPGNTVCFPRSVAHAKALGFSEKSKLLTWGQRANLQVLVLSETYSVPVWRMEDGFLRSVGLGSDMITPASLVVDREGIYYDPNTISELERLLSEENFDDAVLKRAVRLRSRLVESGVSKYNVGNHRKDMSIDVRDRAVILVPGQVEDDASIRLGTLDISTNLGLLQAARHACPDAFIIFKPHPDVISGNRLGAVSRESALQLCNHVEDQASLAQCLAVADQVHVMTSLVGFEALIRGIEVHVYGKPFYAGWGLTKDLHTIERRTRKLSLDQLVAGTYILYPRYLNRKSFRFTSVEAVIDQLEIDRANGEQALTMSWAARQLYKATNIVKETVPRGF